jgi:hypothetical protein
VAGTEAATEARVSEPLRKEGFFYYGRIETDGARKVFFQRLSSLCGEIGNRRLSLFFFGSASFWTTVKKGIVIV